MRRLVVLGSVSGAPGVTVSAVALAAAWPASADGGVRPVVVEADCSGGDLAVRYGVAHTPGLLDVAAAAGQPQPGSLLGATGELSCGVRAVAAPAGRGSCREAVRVLATGSGRRVLTGEDGDRGTVLLDVGRLGEESEGLVGVADEVVLVAWGGAEALSHVYAYGLEAAADAGVGRVTLAAVGPCPYSGEEIRQTLGVGRVVFLPWDARGVAALAVRGGVRTAGVRARPLLKAAREVAGALSGVAEGVPGGGLARAGAAS